MNNYLTTYLTDVDLKIKKHSCKNTYRLKAGIYPSVLDDVFLSYFLIYNPLRIGHQPYF